MNEIERRHIEWAAEKKTGTIYQQTIRWRTRTGEEKTADRWICEFSFIDHAGTRRTLRDTRSTTRKEAERALTTLRDRAWLAKQPPAKQFANQSVRDWLLEWHRGRLEGINARKGRPLRGTTALNEKRHVDLLGSLIGDEPLRGLSRDTITSLIETLKTKTLRGKPRAQEQVYQVLHKALHDVRPRLPADLFDDVVRPETTKSEATALNPAHLALILDAVDKPRADGQLVDEVFAAIVHVLVHGGLRIGECLALQWADVDFEGERLHVRASMAEIGPKIERTPTKSGKERVIPLRPALLDRLRRLRAQTGTIPHPKTLVFANERGGPLRKSNLLRRRLHVLLDELELDRVGFHAFRHSFASYAIQAGVDVGTVSHLLGHGGIKITLETYGHHIPGREHEGPAAIEAAIEKASRS